MQVVMDFWAPLKYIFWKVLFAQVSTPIDAFYFFVMASERMPPSLLPYSLFASGSGE